MSDVLVGPQTFACLRGRVGFRLGSGVGEMVKVGGLGINYPDERPHNDRSTRMCVKERENG